MEVLHWMRWFALARAFWPYDPAGLTARHYAAMNHRFPDGPCDTCGIFTGKTEKLREDI